ncbi:hypothetical protein Hanom_Chr06g00537831 [Helianthus anomalus]
MALIQEDEGFNWDKYIPREKVLVAEVDNRWQRDFARHEIIKFYDHFEEAQIANRWDAERDCFLDPQGNPMVDPKKVDFNAATAVFPTYQTFYTRRSLERYYEANLYKHLNEVFYASLPKVMDLKKKKEEDVEKLVEEMKKTARKADENQQKTMKIRSRRRQKKLRCQMKLR